MSVPINISKYVMDTYFSFCGILASKNTLIALNDFKSSIGTALL